MRVLLTRSEWQNASMLYSLEQKKIEVVQTRLIEQQSLADSEQELEVFLQAALAQHQPINHIVFISPSSVEFGAAIVFRQCVDQIERGHIFAVGRGSAMLLKAQFPEIIGQLDKRKNALLFPSKGAGSKALLALPEMVDIQSHTFLLVTGSDGKPYLEQELLSRGALVLRWECYERTKPKCLSNQINSVLKEGVDVVFLHSAHAARYFLESTSPDMTHSIHAIVGAQTIAQEISKLGWQGDIHQAQSPMPKDMLDCFEVLHANDA